MKRLCSFFYLALICLMVNAQNFVPGVEWLDNNGAHINAHGGGILCQNGIYYWFGEHRMDTTKVSTQVGVTCYSSKDLVNWKYEGVALSMLPERSFSDIEKGGVIERPKVIYNKKTDKCVMWFHVELKWLNTIGERFSAARSGIAIADKVTGPFRFIRSIRTTSGCWPENMPESERNSSVKLEDFKNGTPEWWQAVREGAYVRRDFKAGQMARDMTLYVDDDGKAYHIFASEDNTTLHLAELTDDYLDYTGRYIRIDPAGYNEGPTIFKKAGTYYMITSGCTGWAPNEARLFSATSIWGPWVKHPNPFQGDDAKLSFHTQGTYILPVPGKKDAFIYMADRWTPEKISNSRHIWLPIQFENELPVLKWIDSWSLDFFNKK